MKENKHRYLNEAFTTFAFNAFAITDNFKFILIASSMQED